MITQKTAIAILIGGIIWFAFVFTMPDLVMMPGFGPFQPVSNPHNWTETILETVYKLPGAALGCLAVLTMISLPVSIYSRLARRRAAFKRLAASAPHGKYLLWGRNLRRHACLPARYSGLRPRKPLRALRHLDE